jgi:hypothetical protein
VTGYFFFQKLGLFAARLYTNKCIAHLFYSSWSSSTSASDAEKHIVDHAIALSVHAIDQISSNTPCLFATVYMCKEISRLGRKLRWQRLRLQT